MTLVAANIERGGGSCRNRWFIRSFEVNYSCVAFTTTAAVIHCDKSKWFEAKEERAQFGKINGS
jgi:hypothetical protein